MMSPLLLDASSGSGVCLLPRKRAFWICCCVWSGVQHCVCSWTSLCRQRTKLSFLIIYQESKAVRGSLLCCGVQMRYAFPLLCTCPTGRQRCRQGRHACHGCVFVVFSIPFASVEKVKGAISHHVTPSLIVGTFAMQSALLSKKCCEDTFSTADTLVMGWWRWLHQGDRCSGWGSPPRQWLWLISSTMLAGCAWPSACSPLRSFCSTSKHQHWHSVVHCYLCSRRLSRVILVK